MWGEFAALPAHGWIGVLEGHSSSLDQLASSFLRRFFLKVRMRRPYIVQDDAGNALRLISRTLLNCGLPGGELAQRQRDWCALIGGGLGERRADELYLEARSYGLITEEEPWRWRWRHPFVYDYLRRQ